MAEANTPIYSRDMTPARQERGLSDVQASTLTAMGVTAILPPAVRQEKEPLPTVGCGPTKAAEIDKKRHFQ